MLPSLPVSLTFATVWVGLDFCCAFFSTLRGEHSSHCVLLRCLIECEPKTASTSHFKVSNGELSFESSLPLTTVY